MEPTRVKMKYLASRACDLHWNWRPKDSQGRLESYTHLFFQILRSVLACSSSFGNNSTFNFMLNMLPGEYWSDGGIISLAWQRDSCSWNIEEMPFYSV